MKLRVLRSATFAILLMVAPGPLRADITLTNEIAFEALATDMLAATFNLSYGLDTTSTFTDGGNLADSGGSETLGGTFQGLSLSGTIGETVSADPEYSLSSNSVKWGTKDGPPLTMILTGQNGAKFTLMNASIGQYTWTSPGGLTMTTDKNGNMVFTGDLMAMYTPPNQKVPNTYNFSAMIVLNPTDGTITSVFKQFNTAMAFSITDKGKYSMLKAGLDMMNDSTQVSLVPEPPGSLLVGTAAAVGLGYWGWRRRAGKGIDRRRPCRTVT